MIIYSIEQEAVEPVFYPVVPDSFMSRDAGRVSTFAADSGREWAEATDSVMAAPQDPWSF